MKKNYTGAEIIFGTRNEYLDLNDKFRKLRDLTDISRDKQIKDVDFYVRKDTKEEKPDLYCTFKQNDKTLRGLKEHLEKDVFHTYVYGRDIAKVLRSNNDEYFLPHDFYNAYISKENQKEFGKVATEILNSDFCNNSNFSYISCGENLCSLTKNSNGIYIYNELGLIYDKPDFLCHLDYLAYEDIIRIFGNEQMPITKDLIERMLNVTIKAEDWTDYEKRLIDSSKSASKPIYIDDSIEAKKDIKLGISEYEDKIRIYQK